MWDFLVIDDQLIKISIDYSLALHTLLPDSRAVSPFPSLARGSPPAVGPLGPFPLFELSLLSFLRRAKS